MRGGKGGVEEGVAILGRVAEGLTVLGLEVCVCHGVCCG